MFICNTVKCRPPNNRDPHPNEIESCNEYLRSQVELIQPTVICTLGNFSTKLLRGDNTGISRLHGQVEVRTIGARAVRLYPLYHPAAALYTPSTLEVLRADFHRIPELLALGAPGAAPVSGGGDPGARGRRPRASRASRAGRGAPQPAGEVREPDESESDSETDAPKSGADSAPAPEAVRLAFSGRPLRPRGPQTGSGTRSDSLTRWAGPTGAGGDRSGRSAKMNATTAATA